MRYACSTYEPDDNGGQSRTGRVTDHPYWPPGAVRELIGNAVVHRDLPPWALGETALRRLDNESLITRNPGGLYGLDLSRPWNKAGKRQTRLRKRA